MKYTVESLKSIGYTGCQRNPISGHIESGCNYVLVNIAWAANNKPSRLRFARDNIGGKVRVYLIKDWQPSNPLKDFELYAERNMTASELQEAEKELQKAGVRVVRGN